jgi:hypothetical protein
VHGPYSLVVVNPDGAIGTMSLNGTPVFLNNLSGPLESQPVTLESANTLTVELYEGRRGTLWVAVFGWEYAFASDYQTLPTADATSSITSFAYPSGGLNWVTKGAVTGVKSQGAFCPASWAFSATGAIESAIAIEYGHLTSLSEQEFINCSAAPSCLLGDTPLATNWAVNNGDATEAAYPYTGAGKRACNASSVTPSANTKITGFHRGTIGDENALGAMVDIGPVSVVINGNWFASYTGGVANPDCESQIPSFWSVLVVGYGVDTSTGTDYWLVKNSLGTGWGEAGYFRIVRNQNKCGIADYTLGVED